MPDDGSKWRGGRGGCTGGCFGGCGSFIFVFLLGGLLSLFGAGFGAGVSVRVPFMQSNVTLAGTIGTKAKATEPLPAYAKERLGGNQNFINQSITLTVGPAEGVLVFIVGEQPGAPAVDLVIALR